jgi:hypothetical protein
MPTTASAEGMDNVGFNNNNNNNTNTRIERVQNSAVQRGGFQVGPLNMEKLSHQLSPEYLEYQQTLNSPPDFDIAST